MPSPLALVLDEDPAVRQRVLDRLSRSGIEAVAAGTPREAADLLRAHPFAVVVTVGDSADAIRKEGLETLCRLRAEDGRDASAPKILGRSDASEGLRRRVLALAASRAPVLFTGEAGSGRRHAARCVHALSGDADGFFVLRSADRASLSRLLAERRGTVFVPSIDQLAWRDQEALAGAMTDAPPRARIMSSTTLDPQAAAGEGRLSRPLVAAFGDAIVRVPPLRERPADVAVLVRTFIEELRRLNGLPPLAVAPDALAALEAYRWPENVRQLRSAVESAVILATGGVVKASDLPEDVLRGAGGKAPTARLDGRFREVKRSIVEAFERDYLQELLKRHRGNVTGAAEQSGMLRSALQRLLRKHDLRSADFRRGASGPPAS